ncbi:MAG: hypothetical protein IJ512_07930, partial [Ruminococcus sp.]|nr:hypothetical protein [Ruminococcus sp.]
MRTVFSSPRYENRVQVNIKIALNTWRKQQINCENAGVQGYSHLYLPIPRGLNFAEICARGGGGLLPMVHRDRIAPWGPDFALAKRESRPFRPDFFTA